MLTEDGTETPSERADKILYRVYREVAEILLKVITWSVMIGAVKYAGEISSSTTLRVAGWIAQIILLMYLYGTIYRLEENIFSPKNIDRIFGRHYVIGITLSVVTTAILFYGSILLTGAIVDAFVTFQIQSHRT